MAEQDDFGSRLKLMEGMIPTDGYNVVQVDDFARNIEDELELVGHFDSKDEAEAKVEELVAADPDAKVYIYGAELNDGDDEEPPIANWAKKTAEA